MKKRTLSVVLPDSTVATRQTHRPYTHVIAARRRNGKWLALTWTTQPAAALDRDQVYLARHVRDDQDIVELKVIILVHEEGGS